MAVAEANLDLDKMKETVRTRMNSGIAMSHQEREFVKKQFKETFGEDLYMPEGYDGQHDGSDDCLFNRIFHTSHSQVDSNALH